MAKIETAEEFKALLQEGKYTSKVNAQRGAGRTRLSQAEKKKAFDAIDAYFGESTPVATPKASKRMAKVAKKKKASKKAKATRPAEATAPPPAAATPAPKAAPKKKVASKGPAKVQKQPEGTLPISPSQVSTVADVLQLIDGTVTSSVSVITALQRANELSGSGDITEGVKAVKAALTNAAHLLHQQVVAPLAKVGTQVDAEVANRLEQVMGAASVNDAVLHMPSTEQPPPYLPPPVGQLPPS